MISGLLVLEDRSASETGLYTVYMYAHAAFSSK